jgi:glycosyltransferase involved in cell wall biosynthesis
MMTARAPVKVLNVFGRLERGGAELRAIELAEALSPSRVRSDFVVLSGADGVLDDRVRAAGGEVIKCALDRVFPAKFYALLRRRRYDVVHSHVHYFSGVILAIARASGVRGRVVHLHTAIVNDRADTAWRRSQLALCRALLERNATDIVAVGEGAMRGAWHDAWSSDPRCRIIYNGIRLERLSSLPKSRADQPTIVNVGSIKPLKNQRRLIGILRGVARTLPDVRLQLIGKEVGDYGHVVRRTAAEAGIADRVQLIGEVDEPLDWIARAHAMVLPSLWEGLPCALLEACVTATPAIVSDLPGTREVARHFPGLRVLSLEDGDEVWAEAVLNALRTKVPNAGIGAERFARSPFAFPRFVDAHFEIWSRWHATA